MRILAAMASELPHYKSRAMGELRPECFASCTLSPAETRCAQIEKECLASVWACEKFCQYLWELQTIRLVTDHKSLVPLINNKDLYQLPLNANAFSCVMRFNVAAEHVPGKSMVGADALSHSPLPTYASDHELSEEEDAYVHGFEASFLASKGKLDVIRDASRLDHV